jgi:anti-sigma regulatory factor (Ser/Thr protein kinase)
VGVHRRLAHDALVYDSDDRYVEVLAPFLANGLRAGEQACVVTRSAKAALLREALGRDADHVDFIDAVDWYRQPARTIAGYHRTIRSALTAGAPGLRVVGEVEFGDSKADHAAWIRYESIINAVFADDPAWVICPYDARRLPSSIVESARITHSHQATGPEQRGRSEWFVDPTQFVSALPLDVRGDVIAELGVHGDLRPVRQLAAQLARRFGLPHDRAVDLTLVLNELASNALVHGRPPAHLRVCCAGETLTVEVTDAGTAEIDPLAGFRPPSRDRVSGSGLWICRQLADCLEIASGPGGTTVRLRLTLPGS